MNPIDLYRQVLQYALENPVSWDTRESKRLPVMAFISAHYRHIDLGRKSGKTQAIVAFTKDNPNRTLVVTGTVNRAHELSTAYNVPALSVEFALKFKDTQTHYKDVMFIFDDVSYRNAMQVIKRAKLRHFVHLGQG